MNLSGDVLGDALAADGPFSLGGFRFALLMEDAVPGDTGGTRVVPLPAGAWLLSGLAALGVARRVRGSRGSG